MNEAKRVSDMTDQEVIAELRKWEAERDRLQRRMIWTSAITVLALTAIIVAAITAV